MVATVNRPRGGRSALLEINFKACLKLQKLYPEIWIKDAIKEAVTQNKRKWNYISAILERWAAEGKSNGTHKRDFKKTDPDKYIKGKYGHMVRR
ncbi:DnaD domain protein [Chloroflexota bacterium]